MTREEITKALNSNGIEYNKFWKTDKLEALLPKASEPETPKYTDEEISNIARSVSGKDVPPIEKTLELTTREGGEAVTKSGIVVPGSVLASYKPTKWAYRLDKSADSVRVYRATASGYNETVREYSRAVHGDGFLSLAESFARKNS